MPRELRILFADFQLQARKINYGIAYLSAVAKEAGHKTFFVGIISDNQKEIEETIRKKVRQVLPDILAISVNEVTSDLVSPLAQEAKSAQPGILVLLGGSYPTLAPLEAAKTPFVDCVFLDEAEGTFLELLANLSKAQKNSPELSRFFPRRGIAFLHGKSGKVVNRGPPNRLPDLDSLPLPDYDIFPKDSLMAGKPGQLPVMVSRGCPFSCTYCFASRMSCKNKVKGREAYRELSPKRAIEVLSELKDKFNPTHLLFLDNVLFPLPKSFGKFSKEYSQNIGTPFGALSRPELCGKERSGTYKKMGAEYFLIGFESANKAFRRKILNRKYSDKTATLAFSNLRLFGIKTCSLGMVGVPYQTRAEINALYKFNGKNADFASTSLYFPTKGTPLGELCHKNGWVLPTPKVRQRMLGQADYMLSTNGVLDRREVLGLYRKASATEEFYRGNYPGAFVEFLKLLGRPALSLFFREARLIKSFGKNK